MSGVLKFKAIYKDGVLIPLKSIVIMRVGEMES